MNGFTSPTIWSTVIILQIASHEPHSELPMNLQDKLSTCALSLWGGEPKPYTLNPGDRHVRHLSSILFEDTMVPIIE